MASIDALARQVKQLRQKANRDWLPKTWCFCLEEGEELPDAVRARFGPHDTVYKRIYPAGLFGPDMKQEPGTGYCYWGGPNSMQCMNIKPDGTLEKVSKR